MGNPYASVVILTTGKVPERLAQNLADQTFKDFEVIIASEKGIVHAMNLALQKARGEILVRVDDDVELPETWLESLLMPFKDSDVAGVTGPTFVPWYLRGNRDSIKIWENPNWFLRWLTGCDGFNPAGIYKCGMVSYDSNYAERFHHDQGGLIGLYTPDHLEGTNWAMRTELIRWVGGFDPAFDGVCEWFDTDVEKKITKLGYELKYNPKAYLWHNLDFTENYNDRFDGWGRIKNWLRFHKRHSKFHWKMVVYLVVWVGYFISKRVKK